MIEDDNGSWVLSPPLILGVAAAAVYSPAVVLGYFLADDFQLGRLHAESGAMNWSALLSILSCRDTFGFSYRPVAYISLALDWLVWRENPAGYFMVNVSLHTLIALCVYSVVRLLGWGSWPAVAGALATAMHPLHVESVWWVVGRFDLLAASLSVVVLAAYLVWLTRGSWLSLLLILLLYFLAALAKEAAMTLPVALPILARLKVGDSHTLRTGQHARLFVSMAFVVGIILLIRKACLGTWIGLYPIGGQSPADPYEILRGIPRFLAYMVFPVASQASAPVIAGLAGTVGVAALAILVARTRFRRDALWSVLLTLALAFPVLALTRQIGDPVEAGRLFVLPSVGLGILVASVCRARTAVTLPLLGTLLLASSALLAQYQFWWMMKAQTSRAVLRQLETVATQHPDARLDIVQLPQYFGQRNWALPLAARPPFISAAPDLTLPGESARPSRRRVALAWDDDRRTFVVDAHPAGNGD